MRFAGWVVGWCLGGFCFSVVTVILWLEEPGAGSSLCRCVLLRFAVWQLHGYADKWSFAFEFSREWERAQKTSRQLKQAETHTNYSG